MTDEKSALESVPGVRACPVSMTECIGQLPDFGPKRPFRRVRSSALAIGGMSLHRSRDAVALEGQDVWAIAKFSYGLLDADLKDEEVDAYLSAGCGKPWEKLGTFATSTEKEHPPLDGIEDSGGRVYLNVTEALGRPLAAGRYRVLFVVPADFSTTMLSIEVLPRQAAIVVTDVDGTLTSSEYAAATTMVGSIPEAHPGAVELMRRFYRRGYTIHYLTARPEWLGQISREWLELKGFPPGILTTTQFKSGAIGDKAMQFKIDEMNLVKDKTQIVPSFAFGNKASDVQAFGSVGIAAASSYYFGLDGDLGGGHRHRDYRSLFSIADQAPLICRL